MTQTAYIYDDMSRCAPQFTGKERDSETGLDYFGARYYGSTMGRWLSPDWSAVPTPVPYANLANPQSLNLYGYVLNSPVTNRDPDGHVCLFGKLGNTCKPEQPRIDPNLPLPPTPVPPPVTRLEPTVNLPERQYKTPEAAGKDKIKHINTTSVREDREYAGRAVRNANGTYGATGPNPGTRDSSDPGPVPSGTVNALRYHTHGGNDPGYDNEHFSDADKQNARREHVPSLVGTPGGDIRKFNPATGSDVVIDHTPHSP